VIDIIVELLDTNHKRAKSYWSTLKERLKKEGNESVTKCDQLKLNSADGKMRLNDVVNTEQALRLIQSIPSPKAEPMKLWLAQVGAERLEEADDPELAFLRTLEAATHKFQSEGKSESWIAVRVEGIVARKEFVEALQEAVIDAIPKRLRWILSGWWRSTSASRPKRPVSF